LSRFLVFTLLAIFIGCGKSDQTGKSEAGAAGGTSIPARIVVIGPSTAETLLELGLRERIAAVSDFCLDPRADGLPRIGGQFDPNLERITALNPDLVIVQGGNPKVRSLCSQLNIRFLSFQTDSLNGWFDEVRELSKLFEAEEAGDEILNSFQTEIAQFKEAASEQRPGVAIVISRDGARSMIAVGSGSFLHELLEIAGGRNVFASNEHSYFDLAEEALLQAAPELLFDLSAMAISPEISVDSIHSQKGSAQPAAANTKDPFLALRKAYPQLPAVKRNQLYALNQDYVFLPGPRMLMTLRTFRNQLIAE